MYYYKVVKRSCIPTIFYSITGNPCVVQYAIGKTTKPKWPNSPLMAFETAKHAKNWINLTHNEAILCGIGEPFYTQKVHSLPDAILMLESEIEDFWNSIQNNEKPPYKTPNVPPVGTIFLISFKPIEVWSSYDGI